MITKKKISVSIDEKLLDMLDEHMKDLDLPKRSAYIQKLIEDDMKSRGIKIKNSFER